MVVIRRRQQSLRVWGCFGGRHLRFGELGFCVRMGKSNREEESGVGVGLGLRMKR